ncbi:MAG: hypothetical protein HPZ91_17595 [Lentisphaeria bacterium]|nr:hypothetical protein [Lentisphaeria bacterium]
MLLRGIGITLATGVVWCCIGIVYGRAAEKKEGFYLFLFLGALFFLLAVWTGAPPQAAPAGAVSAVAAVMVPAGIAGQFGFLALRGAMRRGSHSVSWSIAQSAMLCPFAAGLALFGERATFWRIAGMALLLASLVPLSRSKCDGGEREGSRAFLRFAFFAFGLLGLQQTLTLLPNRLPGLDAEALSWRVPLLSFCGLGWIAAVIRRREFRAVGVLPLALLYGILVAAGQWMLFRALDILTQCGAAGIAYPLAVGSSIALFFLYSVLIRGERTGLAGTSGILLAVFGMVLLAF